MSNFKQGDLVRWSWKQGCEPGFTHDPYWCKTRTAIVLKDGRWVDTFWHSFSDSENCWSQDYEVPPTQVDAVFLINTADLCPLKGPREQYVPEDVFYLCDGGGGARRTYMRSSAQPQRELIQQILERRLADALYKETQAKKEQNQLLVQLAELKAGAMVYL